MEQDLLILTRTDQQTDRGGSLVGVSTSEKGRELIEDGGYRNSFKKFWYKERQGNGTVAGGQWGPERDFF